MHLDASIPGSHRLPIASIQLDCSSRAEEVILGMCDPLCVQRLRLNNSQCPEWQTFINLRSLSFMYDTYVHNDKNLLTQICTLCPWIVNLEVSGQNLLTDEVVIPAIKALMQLRTFNCEYERKLTDRILYALIEHHKHTLEAVYLYGCDFITAHAINQLLKHCVRLNTVSCKVPSDFDCSLMGNLTTLIINFPSGDVWNGMQQHCHSLQCLHLAPPLNVKVFSHVNGDADAINLQALRTVYTTREYVFYLRLRFPSVCFVEEEDDSWYDLFKLPI